MIGAAGAGGPVLRLENLARRYAAGRPAVFERLDLELGAGEYVAIMGESGVGKSTLLNLLAGLDEPDEGRVWIEGVELFALGDDARTLLRRRAVGFVFQAFHVLPYLTVEQNVALPLELLRVPAALRAARIRTMLDAVGLGGLAHRFPRELSGGEVQRIAIARALVHRPRLVLADEPTGNLDTRNGQEILELLRALNGQGTTVLVITHDREIAATLPRRVELRDGRLVHDGA